MRVEPSPPSWKSPTMVSNAPLTKRSYERGAEEVSETTGGCFQSPVFFASMIHLIFHQLPAFLLGLIPLAVPALLNDPTEIVCFFFNDLTGLE